MSDLTTAQRLAAYRDELTVVGFEPAVVIGMVRIAARSNGAGLVLESDKPEIKSIVERARDVVTRLEELAEWDELARLAQARDLGLPPETAPGKKSA